MCRKAIKGQSVGSYGESPGSTIFIAPRLKDYTTWTGQLHVFRTAVKSRKILFDVLLEIQAETSALDTTIPKV